MNIHDRKSLQVWIEAGHRVKYVFFWGHQQRGVEPTKACFSQWFMAPFVLEGVTYPTAEHFMMAEKAKLFGDDTSLAKILEAAHPGEAKTLGRQISTFREDVWHAHRFDIVVRANLAKFSQHLPLKNFLLSTGSRVLVEASPRDPIWGIGLAQDDARVHHPSQWLGENLLGFALMAVRQALQVES